jgi:undecaprenyl-diphosphatase
MLDHLNLALYSSINAHAGLHGLPLLLALFGAEWLILLVPLLLVLLWTSGETAQRQAALRASLAVALALAINGLIGLAWFHPRPFMAGVGHTFMHHAPDSSFPSDHGTIMFTVALALCFSLAPRARRFGTLLLPAAAIVAWARVYLGVHYPLDMAGALLVAGVTAALFSSRAGDALCAGLVPMLEAVYRRVLAAPIARGWLRP